MKKVFYNSWLAKAILFPQFSTITIMAWVFTKYRSLKQAVINHECTHARQWTELAIASGILIWLGILIFGYSAWCVLFAAAVFYIWYGLEYGIRFLISTILDDGCTAHDIYKSVSFEQEARFSEEDNNYLENSNYFAWTKFLFK